MQDLHTLNSGKTRTQSLADIDLHGFLVEHRGVEPLTSTMRMSRATNCANAPYWFPEALRGSFPRFTSAGLETPFRVRPATEAMPRGWPRGIV